MASNPQPFIQSFPPSIKRTEGRVVRLLTDEEPMPRRSAEYREKTAKDEGVVAAALAAPKAPETPAPKRRGPKPGAKRKPRQEGSTARYARWNDGSVQIEAEGCKGVLTAAEAAQLAEFLK